MQPMSHETEAKFKVDSFASLRRRLRSLQAEYLCTTIQDDSYYDTADRMLLGRDCGLRIRNIRCLRRGARPIDTRPLLTVKGPGNGSNVAKVRREVQVRLDDVEAIEDILKEFGLAHTVTVRKRRISYALGKCMVELDELPVIGRFVEIEAPNEDHVNRVRRMLKLDGEPITSHYVDMLTAARGGSS